MVCIPGDVAVGRFPGPRDEGEEGLPGLGEGVLFAEPVEGFVEGHEGLEAESGLDDLLGEPVGIGLGFVLGTSFLAFEGVILSEFAQLDEGELGGVLALEGAGRSIRQGISQTPGTLSRERYGPARVYGVRPLANGLDSVPSQGGWPELTATGYDTEVYPGCKSGKCQ